MTALLIELIMMALLPTLAFAQQGGGGQKDSSPIATALAAFTLLIGLAKAIAEYAKSRNEKVSESSQAPLALRMIENLAPEVRPDKYPKTELLLWFVGSLLACVYFFTLDLFLLDSLSEGVNVFGLDEHPSLSKLQKEYLP